MGIVTSLVSSAIQQCEYHPKKKELDILFTDGTMASYLDVPEKVWVDFVNSGSPGSFFNQKIRDVYKFK